jgi:hypothetical protein
MGSPSPTPIRKENPETLARLAYRAGTLRGRYEHLREILHRRRGPLAKHQRRTLDALKRDARAEARRAGHRIQDRTGGRMAEVARAKGLFDAEFANSRSAVPNFGWDSPLRPQKPKNYVFMPEPSPLPGQLRPGEPWTPAFREFQLFIAERFRQREAAR